MACAPGERVGSRRTLLIAGAGGVALGGVHEGGQGQHAPSGADVDADVIGVAVGRP